MVSSYSWHPGASGLTSRWPVPVPLAPDELFSTWLVRAALAQGSEPLILTGNLWPRWRPWTVDLDRGHSHERLDVLAKISGIDVPSLNSASLHPIALALGIDVKRSSVSWPWILPQGSRNRKRYGGLQYCPRCLESDVQPYFRLHWRLAWHTACVIHRVSLSDRCPKCYSPIEPHRLQALMSIATCATCKEDLRCHIPLPVTDVASQFQEHADQVVIAGGGLSGGKYLSSKKWFSLARYFLELLRFASRYKCSRLAHCLNSLGCDVDALERPESGLGFELLPPHERAALLANTSKLMTAGGEEWKAASVAERITAATFRLSRKSLPEEIDDIIKWLPQVARSHRQNEQSEIKKPTSRRAVLAKWARLNRKLRRIP